jgi:hypothetical protein
MRRGVHAVLYIYERKSRVRYQKRPTDTDKSNLPDKNKTQDRPSNNRSHTLYNGTKSDASKTVDLLRVVAKLRGQGTSL